MLPGFPYGTIDTETKRKEVSYWFRAKVLSCEMSSPSPESVASHRVIPHNVLSCVLQDSDAISRDLSPPNAQWQSSLLVNDNLPFNMVSLYFNYKHVYVVRYSNTYDCNNIGIKVPNSS